MSRITDPDAIFQALTDCYTRLGDGEVGRFQARLILLLIANAGDDDTVHKMIRLAARPRA